jgi:hypothetical protein
MKPLKEIGDTMRVEELRLIGESYWSENSASEAMVILSLEERRELVLRVWEMARAGIKDTTGAEYDLDGFRYAEGL